MTSLYKAKKIRRNFNVSESLPPRKAALESASQLKKAENRIKYLENAKAREEKRIETVNQSIEKRN